MAIEATDNGHPSGNPMVDPIRGPSLLFTWNLLPKPVKKDCQGWSNVSGTPRCSAIMNSGRL